MINKITYLIGLALIISCLPGCKSAPKETTFVMTSLLDFQNSQDDKSVDLSLATELQVGVNRCEYSEPIQYIDDKTILTNVTKALQQIQVTGLADTISNTETYEWYKLLDSKGNRLCGFSFQNGLLLAKNGRYSVEGLDKLYAIEGIIHEEDWDDYWEDLDWQKREYEDAYSITYPANPLELGSYYTEQLYRNVPKENITSIRIYIDWSDVEPFETSDPETIHAIYDCMMNMKISSKGKSEGSGLKWYIKINYKDPNKTFYEDTYLKFVGSTLVSDFAQSGDTYYTVEGLESLFTITDASVLSYLAENRNNNK